MLDDTGQKERTMSIAKANLYAFVFIIPITLVLLIPFILLWGIDNMTQGFESYRSLIFIVALLFGIVFHELIHGMVWAFYAPHRWVSIQFGIKSLSPYCHCKEPLKVQHYRLGSIMPLIVLGLLPWLISLLNGSGFLLIFGWIFTLAAGGDMISMWLLHDLQKNVLVQDHPSKLGFFIV